MTDTELQVPAPRDATEEGLLASTKRAGERFADDYAAIWEPIDEIAPNLHNFATQRAMSMETRPSLLQSPWYWAGWGLFGTGFIILLVSTGIENNAGLILPWTVNTLVWVIVVWNAFARYMRRSKEYDARQEWLKRVIFYSAAVRLEERKNDARNYDPAVRAGAGSEFVPAGPAPLPQPYGVSHEGAEHLVAEWMAHLGAFEVEVTAFSGDGGIDVSGLNYIAQVKNYAGTVDVAAIRELAGVAYADGRNPLFFTSGVYASGAVAFAKQVGIGLFVYDAVGGSLSPVGEVAERAMEHGL